MKTVSRIDFLHYGNSLHELLALVKDDAQHQKINKTVLLNKHRSPPLSIESTEVVRKFCGSHNRSISIPHFRHTLTEAQSARQIFTQFGCRGFSYKFVSGFVGFSRRLRRGVNLRFALLPDRNLFYPQRVCRYLRCSYTVNHLSHDRMNSIAFAIGTEIGSDWFIFVMQSDLAFAPAAAVREHFRGWRKILFAEIASLAHREEKRLHLISSDDVLRGCYEKALAPFSVPDSWRALYDRTAEDFSMRKVRLDKAVDIQIYPQHRPIMTTHFYQGGGDNKWILKKFKEFSARQSLD